MQLGGIISLITILALSISNVVVVGAQGVVIPDWENSVAFDLLVSQKPVRPGDSFELALVAYIDDGYHLYGPEEQDPSRTQVRVERPYMDSLLSIGKPKYPLTIRRELAGLGEYDLYEDHVAIRVPMKLKRSAKATNGEVRVSVLYQICTDYSCSAPTSDELVIGLEIAEFGAKVQLLYPEIFTKN